MDSSQNSLVIELSSQEYKADLLLVATFLYKEEKLLQKVFDVEWRNVEREGVVF